jgi:threonine dehydrogenase-like Zn-dependent dehydrogenase
MTMRGVYCDGTAARLRRDLPEPEPRGDDVVLRVRAVGICDTDLQLARGYMGFRGILGHEFVGQTDSGRRVTAEINAACHACPTCRAGRPGHCPRRTVLGILDHDGAMAEFVRVPRRNLREIPDALEDREPSSSSPWRPPSGSPSRWSWVPTSGLAVVGDGKLGLLCAWVARLAGARAELIGKHPEKLALAGEGIATHTLDAAPALGRAFDVVVDATGSPTGLPTALGWSGRAGRSS